MFETVNFIFFGYLVIVGSYKIVEGTSLTAETDGGKNISEICTTSECQELSNYIINSINKTADPCNDFYNYACGSYPTNYPVPEGEIIWNHSRNMTKNIQYELIKILQEAPKPEDSVPLSVEKKLFKACIHEDRIERNSIEGLSKVIEGLGGWPMLMEENKWKEEDFPWQKVMQGYIQQNIQTPLFSIGYSPDPKNYSIKVISLKKGIGSDVLKDIFSQVYKKKIPLIVMIDRIDFPSPWLYRVYTQNFFNLSNLFKKSHRLLKLTIVIEKIQAFYSKKGTDKMTIKEFQNYYNRNNSTKNTSELLNRKQRGSKSDHFMKNHPYRIFFGYLVIVGSYKIVEGKSLATETNGEKNISEVCTTSECQDLSNLFINSLNKTADPCNDFYNYACGSYPTNYPVPEGEIVWNHRQNMTKNIQYELIKILQEEPKPEDSVPLSVEKKLFKACVDEDRIEQNSIEGLSKIIEGLGGWPMLMEENKWKEADFPWQKVMQGYIQYNVATPLFSIDYTPDPKNYSINVISLKHGIGSDVLKDIYSQVDKGEIRSEDMIHRIDFLSPWLYRIYTQNFFNFSNLFKKYHRLLKLTIVIEKIEAFYSEEGKEKKTIREFQNYYNRNNSTKNTSEINWLEMIRAYTKDSKLNIDDSEEILIIGDKSYFDTLFKLLEKTSHYRIVNYLHWNFMTSQFVNLKRYNREYIKKLKKRNTGISVDHKNRPEECVEQQWLKYGVSKEYLKRNFPNSFSEYCKEVVEEIRNEIDSGILRANWMDATAKLSTREKLRATKVQIGYPEYFDDEKEFNQLYDGLEVGLDHFDNVMKIKEFERLQKLNELREPYKGNEWSFMNPLMLNAVYHPYHNRITVPAAKLLPKSDNMQLMLLYYAASGHTIGHEFSHAFTTGDKW
ncbi:endothelin-converting enzyme 1-like isoform X2 [Leptopilina heterotoma]|uniref:endothelin-converting enzyme 1-like isoform X2 n=1 Tax=Leptopilina heterotoma TaxID=63436 RepID=UPI001CA9B60A|nr:endothelin-converting enzyme 1-like isoform X2 [Leptopilina heterotoma]